MSYSPQIALQQAYRRSLMGGPPDSNSNALAGLYEVSLLAQDGADKTLKRGKDATMFADNVKYGGVQNRQDSLDTDLADKRILMQMLTDEKDNRQSQRSKRAGMVQDTQNKLSKMDNVGQIGGNGFSDGGNIPGLGLPAAPSPRNPSQPEMGRGGSIAGQIGGPNTTFTTGSSLQEYLANRDAKRGTQGGSYQGPSQSTGGLTALVPPTPPTNNRPTSGGFDGRVQGLIQQLWPESTVGVKLDPGRNGMAAETRGNGRGNILVAPNMSGRDDTTLKAFLAHELGHVIHNDQSSRRERSVPNHQTIERQASQEGLSLWVGAGGRPEDYFNLMMKNFGHDSIHNKASDDVNFLRSEMARGNYKSYDYR